jgi:hypothetical protein
MFFTWIFPAQTLIAIHPTAWPRAITSKSYFTDHLCGAQTERICPQPGVPLLTGDGSLTINPSGQVVIPPNSAAARLYGVHAKTAVVLSAGALGPRPLPFDKRVRGPFTGTLFSWP